MHVVKCKSMKCTKDSLKLKGVYDIVFSINTK